MNLEDKNIEELIELRKESRKNKDWKLSDEIRNYLDSKFVFVFDIKNGDEVYYLNDEYFSHVYNYSKKTKEEEDGTITVIPEWSETQIEKIERLHNIKFESNRKFVEWNIQRDIQSDKMLDAWIYTNTR